MDALKSMRSASSEVLTVDLARFAATPCFEAPEAASKLTDLERVGGRMEAYHSLLLRALILAQGLQHAAALARFHAAQEVHDAVVSTLLRAGRLPYNRRKGQNVTGIFMGGYISGEDLDILDQEAKSGRWFFKLREDKVSSLYNLSLPDRALFAGLALVAYSACPEEYGYGEVVLKWDAAPMSVCLRRFWDGLLSMLPLASLERRRQAHRAVVDGIVAQRHPRHNELSLRARLGWDGLGILT